MNRNSIDHPSRNFFRPPVLWEAILLNGLLFAVGCAFDRLQVDWQGVKPSTTPLIHQVQPLEVTNTIVETRARLRQSRSAENDHV